MRSIRLVLVASASAGLAIALASPAAAKQCGSGQIFQVSRGRCISKAAAAKAGIVIHRKMAALKPAKQATLTAEEDEDERPAKAASGAPAAKAARDDRTRDDDQDKAGPAGGAETPPPVRSVTVRNDPAKAREAWNAAVASAEKGGEPTSTPALGFAPQAADVNRNIAPFGALQFGGLR